MNLQEFINQWNEKPNDYDKKYGTQCKDLFSQYNADVVGNPNYVWGDAWELWNNAPTEYYDKIVNTLTSVPNPGDVIIWKKEFGGLGHVAIFVSGDVNTMVVFGQNYPKVTKLDKNNKVIENGSPCQMAQMPYSKVKGYLRPKKKEIEVNNALTPEQATLLYRRCLAREPENIQATQGRNFEEMTIGIQVEINNRIADLQAREDDAKRKLEACEKQTNVTIVRMQTDIDNLNSDKKSLEANLEAIRSSLESSKQENNQLEDTNIQLSSKNSTLRKNIAELEKKLLACDNKVVVKSFWQSILDFLKGVK